MKKLLTLVLGMFLLLCGGNIAHAQTIKVSGSVKDSAGEPVIANILVKGTTTGAMTDVDGNFTISAKPGAVLQFVAINYETAEWTVKDAGPVKIVLKDDSLALEETVVVGYGTQKKVNLTSAVSSISSEAIATTQGTGVVAKLQGKVPGLNIRQNTGLPGAFDNSINVRGLGEPLYIIDGINRTNRDFQRLNADDIESISVLKDASAAIYGLNAANGVIIVTTRAGSTGKTRFQLSINTGINTPTSTVRMANAYEYYALRNYANTNIGGEPVISKEELELWRTGAPGYESTDWYAETFKKCSVRQEYNISADGGTDKASYFINLNYSKDGSILRSNAISYDKIGFRTNLSAKLTSYLKARVNVNAYRDKRTIPSYGVFNIFRGAMSSLPHHAPYLDADHQYLARVQDGQSYNPVAMASSELTGYERSSHTSVQTNFELSFTPAWAPGLEVKGVAAYDYLGQDTKGLRRTFTMYDWNADTESYDPKVFNEPAYMSRYFAKSEYITTQVQANYKHKFGDKHNLGATFVFETRANDTDYLNLSRKEFDFLANDEVSYGNEQDQKTAGVKSQTRNMSFLGRINYDYAGKYLLELSARYDGSYRYAPSVRWGFFPVVSAGWRISEENFMKNVPVISNLKLRGSYGVVGQDQGNPFQYLSSFTMGGGGWYEFGDGKTTTGVASPALTNEKLSWMKNYMSNVGVDLGLWKGKLSMTLDLFSRLRTGILATRAATLPNTFGADFPQENLNSNRTRGVELSLTHQNTVGEFYYSLSANFTYARTMTRHLESNASFLDAWSAYRNNTENRYAGTIWGYNVIGQFKSQAEIDNAPIYNGTNGNSYVFPGDWIYEDVNQDGVIDGNDMVPIGHSGNPLYNYGLTFEARWKGIDLSILFQGAAGFSALYDGPTAKIFHQDGNLPAYFMDSYHKADPYDPASDWVAGKWPAVRGTTNQGVLYSSNNKWLLDCSYLRIKNIEIGYTIPSKILNKINMDSVRIFVDFVNPFTFCGGLARYYDPEKSVGSNSYGADYPLMKSYNFGININF